MKMKEKRRRKKELWDQLFETKAKLREVGYKIMDVHDLRDHDGLLRLQRELADKCIEIRKELREVS